MRQLRQQSLCLRFPDNEDSKKTGSPRVRRALFCPNCIKKNTILGLTPPKKHDIIPHVANKRNNYVTICNKNDKTGIIM